MGSLTSTAGIEHDGGAGGLAAAWEIRQAFGLSAVTMPTALTARGNSTHRYQLNFIDCCVLRADATQAAIPGMMAGCDAKGGGAETAPAAVQTTSEPQFGSLPQSPVGRR
jgi:hypothetical protein